MQLSNEEIFNGLMELIEDLMTETFGTNVVEGEKWWSYEHMANFEINFDYLPLNYQIYFYGERGDIFVTIYDKTVEEGYSQPAANLETIRERRVGLDEENIKNTVSLLKDVLENEDITFIYYKTNEKYSPDKLIYHRNSTGIVKVETRKEFDSKRKHIWEYER